MICTLKWRRRRREERRRRSRRRKKEGKTFPEGEEEARRRRRNVTDAEGVDSARSKFSSPAMRSKGGKPDFL